MRDIQDPLSENSDAKAAEDKARSRRLQEIDDLKWLMGHAQGRRIVTRIFEKTGIRRTPFNTNGSTMAFNAGMQNAGLWFESEVLEASPDAFIKLLKAYTNE